MALSLTSALIAFLISLLIFPFVLQIAQRYNIVDNPNARKLQRYPIPLLGGVVVYFGILTGTIYYYTFMGFPRLPLSLLGMTIMLVIGTWDDIKGLSVKTRFGIEILTIIALMGFTGVYIDNLHGLWGIYQIPDYIAFPLSLLAGVGIINALNLIDGIDGYSSGYGMFACICFAVLFRLCGRNTIMTIAILSAVSLFTFFLHNVFGKKSKMFIGDGGSLMLGTIMTLFVFSSLSSKSSCMVLDKVNFSIIAYSLAILCVPVFDTLRVMIARMLRGVSPFRPDKTHLHHLFIDMGFSHLGAVFSIVLLNFCVLATWMILYRTGVAMDIQIYVVLLMGFTITTLFYVFMRRQQHGGKKNPDGTVSGTRIWKAAQRIGKLTHLEKGAFWNFMRKFVDNELFKQTNKNDIETKVVKDV